MYVMVDNYDSFVYNLARYFEELGEEIELVRNDSVDVEKLEEMLEDGKLDGIILSPGPKSPKDSGKCLEVLERMEGRVPILGVCLGHQIIGYRYGGNVKKGVRPMHGKVTPIETVQQRLFKELPKVYDVTRYHSLVVEKENMPDCLLVDAVSKDGAVMAVSHKEYPVYGVQFHPEAVLTEYGHEILKNFIDITEEWWREHEHRG